MVGMGLRSYCMPECSSSECLCCDEMNSGKSEFKLNIDAKPKCIIYCDTMIAHLFLIGYTDNTDKLKVKRGVIPTHNAV